MSSEKKQLEKTRLHPRNKNRERYDLDALIKCIPELGDHIKPNKYGSDSVDYSNPFAVKLLNRALLDHYYGIKKWDFPNENLCPPIPGRADYIHHIADLLSKNNSDKIPTGECITCLDVGLGASCIYPIIGVVEYGWKFIGSDVIQKSINSAQNIIASNPILKDKVECSLQKNPNNFFRGIISKEDKIDISISNPPFHSSTEEAQKGSRRKVRNLTGKNEKLPKLNFAGIADEIICEGGENLFINKMINESKKFSKNCYWFSTLVSKQSNLKGIYKAFEKNRVNHFITIPMGTGNKSSRIVAWTFLSKEEQKDWRETRWKIQH